MLGQNHEIKVQFILVSLDMLVGTTEVLRLESSCCPSLFCFSLQVSSTREGSLCECEWGCEREYVGMCAWGEGTRTHKKNPDQLGRKELSLPG